MDWVLRCEIYTTHILVFWLIAFCVDEQRANSDGLHEDSDGAGARDRDAAPNYL
jgi:hypothetical protein